MPAYDIFRRGLLKGTTAATAFALLNRAAAPTTAAGSPDGRSDTGARELSGRRMSSLPGSLLNGFLGSLQR